MLAGSPALPSPSARGWPVPSLGGGGSAATAFCAIVKTSARELFKEEFSDVGESGGRDTLEVSTEKEGVESSRRACARVPSSQLQ